MKKTITRLAFVLLLFTLAVAKTAAIITDPEDYVWYDTGKLGVADPSTTFPDFFEFGKCFFGISNHDDVDVTPNKLTTRGEALLNACGFYDKTDQTSKVYGITMPSSSSTDVTVLTLKLPFCDSIYVEGWRTSGSRGIRVQSNLSDDYGFMGKSSGYLITTGLRPRSKDSVTIYIYNTTKDSPTSYGGSLFINRIKIYKDIEEGDVPVFDGVVAGWDFLYRPKASGTVDLESPVNVGEGEWESQHYPLYASDLGVVRGKLSSVSPAGGMQLGNDCGVQAIKFASAGCNDTVDFSLGTEHDNYFQVEMSTLGYQELSLDFDFNIRDASDSCVVAYSTTGNTFTVAGKFPTPDYDGITHVSLNLPELTNQPKVFIRLLLDNGTYGPGGEFILANLSVNGFEYEEYKPEALDIAYINTAASRIRIQERASTSDSLDLVILPALREKYNVTVFYPDLYAGITDSAAINELFAPYDLVVLSEFPGGASDITKAVKFLVGNKPLLNFKAYAYTISGRWGWANPSNGLYNTEVPVETHAIVGDRFIYHPIFKGLTIGEDNSIQIFDTLHLTRGKTEKDFKGLQGFVTDTYVGPEGFSLASPIGSPNVTCFHEISSNPAAKYMLLAFAAENYANVGEEGLQLVLNAVDYVASPSAFAVPNFNMNATGATVETVEELRAALTYDYSALNLDEILIQVKDCLDPSGIYLLGSDGMAFPQSFNDLSVKAAPGATPQFWGSFRSNNGMKVGTLRFEGLSWNGGDSALTGFGDENYQPFAVLQPDSVTKAFLVTNCRFENFDYQRIFRSNACAGALINKLAFENNYFDNMGWNRPAGSHGQSLIQFVNSNNYQLDSLVFHNNIVKNFHGNQLFNVPRNGTTAAPDTLGNFYVGITHNTFYKLGGQGNSDRNFLEYNGTLGGLNGSVNISNNLFIERWSYEKFPQGYLALPATLADGQSLEVKVLNNFFMPDTVLTPRLGGVEPLQVKGESVVVPVRNNLFAQDLGITNVFEDEQALTISKGSPLYTAGTNRSPLGVTSRYVARQQSGTLRVSNVPELKTALEIAIGGDVIELENCDDPTGVYLLGSSGFAFPQTFGNLTIKAAPEQEPQLFGRLWSSNGMKLDSLIVERLHWNGGDSSYAGFNSEHYAPFQISGPDTIRQAVVVRHSTFRNFDYQPVLRTRNSTGSLVKEWVFTHCLFDNMGWNRKTGIKAFHFIQFEDNTQAELDRFSFTENILKNFHGSQLFNIAISGSPSADSLVVINITNNTFYRLGGNSTDARQFLGFNRKNAFDNYININDNLFIERWSTANKYPNSNLALFTPDSAQVMVLNILNNFFYPDTVQALPGTGQNLPVTEGDTERMTFARNDLFMSNLFMDKIFEDSEKLLIHVSSPLYTAGTNAGYVGALDSYTTQTGVVGPRLQPAETGRLFTQQGTLFVHVQKTQNMSIYNILGKEILKRQLQEGLNAIEGLQQGQVYLIKLDDRVTKVVM